MDVIKAIFNRRSVRDYSDQPVETSVIANLIVAATQAPNAVKRQPWAFMVVRDQALQSYLKTPVILGHPKSAPAPVPRHPPEIRWLG